MIWWIIAALVILLVCVLLCAPAVIDISVRKDGDIFEKKLRVGIGFLRFSLPAPKQKKKPVKKEKEQAEAPAKKKKLSMEDFIAAIRAGVDTVRYLKKKFTIRRFLLHAKLGLSDPASTGIAVGAAYAGIYPLLAICDHELVLKEQSVTVEPVFDGLQFDIDFRCTCGLRLYYCIGLLVKAYKNFKFLIRKEDVK